jgi:hypothetical protein
VQHARQIEGEVQLVGVTVVAGDVALGDLDDLTDQHAVAGIRVDQPAYATQDAVRRGIVVERGMGNPGPVRRIIGSCGSFRARARRRREIRRCRGRARRRSTACMAASTAGFAQLRSGCSGRKRCR